MTKGADMHCTTVLEINCFSLWQVLASVKIGSKLTFLAAKFGGHIIAHWPSIQVVVRFKTKQNPIWSKALTMPLTIWNYV